MISCTEFIPLYSEFFKFLEKRGGYDEVLKYWYYLSDTNIGDPTNPHSMESFIRQYGGYDGAKKYWGHTTSEEACDTWCYNDPVKRFTYSGMNYCPSRGMLNSFKHIEPYKNYCEHCKVIYNRVLEKHGVCYERDHSLVDQAKCSSLLYEEGNRPSDDILTTSETAVYREMKREGKKYLHRDFHLIGDNALRYCGETYGDEEVTLFMKDFTLAFYAPQIEEFKKDGLAACKAWIEKIYTIEESSEVLHTELDKNTLKVKIDYCPVIKYMRELNQQPSKYYIEETTTHYATIAEACGWKFSLAYYTKDGATEFTFTAE